MGYILKTNGIDLHTANIYDLENSIPTIQRQAGDAHGVSFLEYADTIIEFTHRTTKIRIDEFVYLNGIDTAIVVDGIKISYEDLCDYVEILREYGEKVSPNELIEA